MEDVRGLEVEDYKKKPGVDNALGKIRKIQKQLKEFQVVKQLMDKKMEEMGEALMSEGQILLQTLPSQPMRDLEGMQFPDEKEGIKQPSQDSMMMRY